MGHLVGQEGGKLGLVVDSCEEAALDVDDAVWIGEGVAVGVLQDHDPEGNPLVDLGRLEFFRYAVQVLGERFFPVNEAALGEVLLLLLGPDPEALLILERDILL
jgi:hypothetical protein